MSDIGSVRFAGDVSPPQVWNALSQNKNAEMVDVRTLSEWTFVGGPDLEELGKTLWRVEWQAFPAMGVNPDFAQEIEREVNKSNVDSLYFICRSGGRSAAAARAIEAALRDLDRDLTLYNVAEGFEGDLNRDCRRSQANGWKFHGLPWRQT